MFHDTAECCVRIVIGYSLSSMTRPRLPGAELIEQGLADLAGGVVSEEALLVSIGAPRLRSLGVAVHGTLSDPEVRLYVLLAERYGDGTHSKYNALVRRMVSFQRAAPCAI